MIKSKFTLIIFLLTIFLNFPAWVEAGPGQPFQELQNQMDALVSRVVALEADNASQAALITALQAEQAVQNGYISTLQAQVADLLSGDAGPLAAIFDGVSRTDDDILFDGVNVHIRNGSGASSTVNGLGNLIVGYNELRITGINERTGSHNLVLGSRQNYTSSGGLVAGIFNTVSGQDSTITGGIFNVVSGIRSSISGGQSNTASGSNSSVTGGIFNIANETNSSVSGGASNTASGINSSVSGGASNTASGIFSSVSGGNSRTAVGVLDWAAGSLFEDF